MNNSKLKLGMAISAVCFGMGIGAAQAAALIPFSNGTVADANDVNHNFTYLEGLINAIPAGMDGADGMDGAPGADGMDGAPGTPGADGMDGAPGTDGVGVTFQSWAGFGAAVKWSVKVFDVTHSTGAGNWDKETRTLVRTPPTGGTTGTVTTTRVRSLMGTPVKHQVLTYNFDTAGDLTFDQMQNYTADGMTLNDTRTIAPGFILRHNNMGIGMNWATASTITTVDVVGGGAGNRVSYGVDSRSLLAVEDITVKGVPYTGCLKILRHRTAQDMGGDRQIISWQCPNDGLVKLIFSRDTYSRVLEFDPTMSTLQP